MKITEFPSFHDQMSQLGKNKWSVARLAELSREFPVQEVPLDALNLYKIYEKLTLREMVMHCKAI